VTNDPCVATTSTAALCTVHFPAVSAQMSGVYCTYTTTDPRFSAVTFTDSTYYLTINGPLPDLTLTASPVGGSTLNVGDTVTLTLASIAHWTATADTTVEFYCSGATGGDSSSGYVTFDVATGASVGTATKTFMVDATDYDTTISCYFWTSSDSNLYYATGGTVEWSVTGTGTGAVSSSASDVTSSTGDAGVTNPTFTLTSDHATQSTLTNGTLVTFTATFTAGSVVTALTAATTVTVRCGGDGGPTGTAALSSVVSSASAVVTVPTYQYDTSFTCSILSVTQGLNSFGAFNNVGSFHYTITGVAPDHANVPSSSATTQTSSGTNDASSAEPCVLDCGAVGAAQSAVALIVAFIAAYTMSL